jgi:hypothetical protein
VRRMRNTLTLVTALMALFALGLTVHAAQSTVQLGPRPFYLVDQLEDSPARAALAASPTFLRRGLEILSLDGSGICPQDWVVPVGSQWPGNIAINPTDVARPAVIGIQRKQRAWREPWEHDDD